MNQLLNKSCTKENRNIHSLLTAGILLSVLGFSCSSESENPVAPTPTPPEYYGYQVIQEYPHRQDAFTQGLLYHEGFLYESTGLYGHSSLRKVELATGMVLDSILLDNQYFGEGLTLLGDRLYQITWRSNIAFVYRLQDFTPIDTFTYSTEGWGIANDGSKLIMSDGTNIIRFRDPADFQVTGQISVTYQGEEIDLINELEYINGQIYANIWLTDTIAIISPETGEVISWINLENLLNAGDCPQYIDVLNGIAYDEIGNRLFVTGKQWCKLFHIELIAAE